MDTIKQLRARQAIAIAALTILANGGTLWKRTNAVSGKVDASVGVP